MPNELLSENVSRGLSFTYQSLGGVVVVMVGGFCSKWLVTAPVTVNLFKRIAVNCSELTKTMGLSRHGKGEKKGVHGLVYRCTGEVNICDWFL